MKRYTPVILIADDDEHMRLVLTARLTQAGFEVIAAADGNEAIAAIKKRKPDLVLLDVQMPGKDGFGVCEYIRSEAGNADIPVFFLTGAQEGIIRNHLGTLTTTVGGNRYITKPCDGAALTKMLQKTIEGTCGC